jgi:hypothetical protein
VAAAGWIIALGAIVTRTAQRADISWSFIIVYMGAVAMRVAWLGQPWAVWEHQLSNGALLLFTFFMISDPMTTPNDRAARIAHAATVAVIAFVWQFESYRINGFLCALFIAAPIVPLWDWLRPAPKYEWVSAGGKVIMERKRKTRQARGFAAAMFCAVIIVASRIPAAAFCGFYVGKADTGLYNHASQVVYVRHENKNVISIMNDYQGEPSEFALVVPVPVVLEKGQIHVGDRALFDRLEAYSSPRLVEYYDPDPCAMTEHEAVGAMAGAAVGAPMAKAMQREADALGVKIEARYTIGEYDILILSATQSDGLETWLIQNGYKVPFGARRALQPYIRQNMKFFVARVNLKEHEQTGLSYLRPLQFAFESPKFMLPIRLGMINAQGPQDLVIYLLTSDGRVETTNYRTLKVPTGMDIPEYLRSDFGHFYQAMFGHQSDENEMKVVFTEYVWNMGWCDPCAAPPLSEDELRGLGVFWTAAGPRPGQYGAPQGSMMPVPIGGPTPVMLTRLHLRYEAATFPEDLVFQETQDTENFQARYVLRHAWAGSPSSCPAAQNYFDDLRKRRQTEAETVADLTGWPLADVYQRAGVSANGQSKPAAWWENLWH